MLINLPHETNEISNIKMHLFTRRLIELDLCNALREKWFRSKRSHMLIDE